MDSTITQATNNLPASDLVLTRNAWYAPQTFEAASWLTRHLPRTITRSLAVCVGELGYRLCSERREAILGNLAAITSDIDRQNRLCQSCLRPLESFLRLLGSNKHAFFPGSQFLTGGTPPRRKCLDLTGGDARQAHHPHQWCTRR